jgi:diacylglycerol kinase (ATP)
LALARDAVRDGVDRLVVVGGDGMVHLGVQAVAGTDTPLGIVPAGTGDDTARLLGLPRRDPTAAAAVAVGGTIRTADLGRDDAGTWFVGVVAAGFDARVNDRANRMRFPRGQARYNVAMLAELGVFQPIRYRLTLDGVTDEIEAMLVLVGNGRSYGGGMRVTPTASIDDGLLDVVTVDPLGRAAFLRVFPRVYRGTHLGHPAVTLRRAARVELEAVGVTAYADGERLGPLPRTFTAHAQAIRLVAGAASAAPG